jgi:hypothetical protein
MLAGFARQRSEEKIYEAVSRTVRDSQFHGGTMPGLHGYLCGGMRRAVHGAK